MKKIIFIFILFFLFVPFLVLADDRCPDYCSDGILYSGRTYNSRTEECSGPSNRQTCDYGCDGREKCADRTEAPAEVTPTPLEVPPSPEPTLIKNCPNKCENGTFYSGGIYDAGKTRCQYDLVEGCFGGKCDRDGKKCEKKEEAPSCDGYCQGGIKYLNGKPTAQGTCIFEKEVCSSGCSLVNKKACNKVFEIGPAYFTDPNDNKVKPIPEAMVAMKWLFYDIDNKLTQKPLPDRQTNLDGTITVSKSEIYEYSDDDTAQLAIAVYLMDFNNRFKINNNAGNFVPVMAKVIEVAKPETYKVDFDFDVTTKDRRDAKIYYHNWEAVNFSENVLGTKIKLLPPESVSFNDPKCDGACHSSSMGVTTNPVDNGIFYNTSSSSLFNSSSAENLEWHEFCHHIMMDEFGYMVPWVKPCGCGGDCNHCGYPNATSADSWLEGWAEFCGLAIKDYYGYSVPYVYANFGSMEVNYKVKDNEEFAVASALWDLYDKEPKYLFGAKNNPADGVQLTIQQIWNVLRGQYVFPGEKTQRHIHDFSEIYWVFNQSNLPGLKEDVNKDGINNLDDIFIVRDCFGDKNKNNKWDLSEPIGFTFKPAGTTKVRPNRPQKEGAYIGISLKDVNDQEIQGARAKIKVSFQNDSCGLGENCDYEYEVPVENGKIYIEPPTEDFDAMVEIAVFSQEKNLKLAKFSVKDYWKKYDVKKDFVQSYDLKVDDFQNIPESPLFLSDIISRASQEKVLVESSQLTNSVYKISGFKNVKLLRIKSIKMKVKMEIDAQTGNILKLEKPWWRFLVF